MVKIFVGNVASATTEAELRALFEKHGAVSDCDILKNYGFVHMDEEEAAQKAVAALHKHVLNGSRITVEYATTKTIEDDDTKTSVDHAGLRSISLVSGKQKKVPYHVSPQFEYVPSHLI